MTNQSYVYLVFDGTCALKFDLCFDVIFLSGGIVRNKHPVVLLIIMHDVLL